MKIEVSGKKKVKISQDMFGLFFEDINYAADGGIYAEMIENRSFEFMDSEGQDRDFITTFDGGYGWSAYPEESASKLRVVMSSPLTEENPHYMRVETTKKMAGLKNKAYDGMLIKKGIEYNITFWARCKQFEGNFAILLNGTKYGEIAAKDGTDETYNFYKKYELTVRPDKDMRKAEFALCLDEPGIVEFDYISVFPGDAVAGLFRRDLFELLKDLHPSFLRFPGGCIIEGATLVNRYRYKDGLKEPWARKNNWNRWSAFGANKENGYKTQYSHYNQTYGMGFYEYFVLCELIGAKPLPVLNVGMACEYQSLEYVDIESAEFEQYVQDALDLIEFANGGTDTKWGAVRAKMGHEKPFGLSMIGIGNEQWERGNNRFYNRFERFSNEIRKVEPSIRIIGTAGPDLTSEKYTSAWEFYDRHKDEKDFVYAVDEHYYVRPRWLYENNAFYDNYRRDIKVFAGEYAAHPFEGNNMNHPDFNTLDGALSEAAFLTGVERNADVVCMASYAPLFARVSYTQWSPDLIWFDDQTAYGSPSYYVQKMYACNVGTATLDTNGFEKETEKYGIYYNTSIDEKSGDIIIKLVNRNESSVEIEFAIDEELEKEYGTYTGISVETLEKNEGRAEKNDYNSIAVPLNVCTKKKSGKYCKNMVFPALSFSVVRLSACVK